MDKIPWEGGIYDCNGSDERELVYAQDRIHVLACYYYGYVDILGLDKEEFKEYVAFLKSHESRFEEDCEKEEHEED